MCLGLKDWCCDAFPHEPEWSYGKSMVYKRKSKRYWKLWNSVNDLHIYIYIYLSIYIYISIYYIYTHHHITQHIEQLFVFSALSVERQEIPGRLPGFGAGIHRHHLGCTVGNRATVNVNGWLLNMAIDAIEIVRFPIENDDFPGFTHWKWWFSRIYTLNMMIFPDLPMKNCDFP